MRREAAALLVVSMVLVAPTGCSHDALNGPAFDVKVARLRGARGAYTWYVSRHHST